VDIVALLNSCPELGDLVAEWATPEHRVRFDEFRGEPRNSDLVAIAESDYGSVAISVEAKADETFTDGDSWSGCIRHPESCPNCLTHHSRVQDTAHH